MEFQKKLVGSYFAVILITVCILGILLIALVKYYYYDNVERILMNQAEISASFFQQYFADEDLEKQSERLLRVFAQKSAAQVQIINSDGMLLQDSTGQQTGITMTEYQDVREALRGSSGGWKGLLPSTNEAALAVSYPLQSKDKAVGIVRFVTSLTETNRTIKHIATLFISIGLIVVVIVAALSLFLSRAMTRSMTELKQMRRNEQLKNDFISSISHEIRTPLTSIKGWLITLKSGHSDGKVTLEEGFEIIETETDRLTAMVDELLDFSKLENGRLALDLAFIHPPELLQHIGKQLAPRAARQGVSLEVQADDALPVIRADENRLKQVFINLIDNSLKHTKAGGSIKIYARSHKGQVTIAVEDTGEGITERDILLVRQKFYKGNNSIAGSGLGLSISEEIVKLHKGRLTIESQVGKGTKVVIYLPH